MIQCYPNSIFFSSVQRRKMEAAFSGGAITGNGGIPLLAEVGRQLGLTRLMSRHLGVMHAPGQLWASIACWTCSDRTFMHWPWDLRT